MSQGSSSAGETERVRAIYEALAPRYDRLIGVVERILFSDGRQWVCGRATGNVLEVAIGTGRNLPHCRAGVSVTGVDVSPKMLELARFRAANSSAAVDLRLGDAQKLPFPASRFDTVVATLALCSIPDEQAAVAEMTRVLKPGGLLVLLDHVAGATPPVRLLQRILNPITVRLQGDHLLRNPETAVRRAGLHIEQLTRSRSVVLRLAARKSAASTATSPVQRPAKRLRLVEPAASPADRSPTGEGRA